ncbi:MAG: hypothetical protein AABW65_01920 [Nanoarchaeota archaeon]|mgnify:CR=1 FL=1
MLPKWHVLYGALFSAFLWLLSPNISLIYLALTFLASFLIDFDHYINSVIKTKRFSLTHALEHHKKLGIVEIQEREKGIRKKEPFHLFHTVEFHVLIGILGIFWIFFFFIFIGIVFHSLLDLFSMIYKDRLYRREFFFFNWLRKNL